MKVMFSGQKIIDLAALLIIAESKACWMEWWLLKFNNIHTHQNVLIYLHTRRDSRGSRGSFVKATHNGVDYKCGYKGFHIKEITEPNAITPITSVINGRTYMTGPAPTVNGLIQTAIKDGTIHNLSNSNVMKCEVLVWGYAGRKVGGNWVLDLDSAGNPVQCWVKKINNRGETTMFIGMTDDKILNEVAFARFNLELDDFVRPTRPTKVSNEWIGISSEGFKINMYINPSYDFWTLPTNLPNLNTVYNSSFPKIN